MKLFLIFFFLSLVQNKRDAYARFHHTAKSKYYADNDKVHYKDSEKMRYNMKSSDHYDYKDYDDDYPLRKIGAGNINNNNKFDQTDKIYSSILNQEMRTSKILLQADQRAFICDHTQIASCSNFCKNLNGIYNCLLKVDVQDPNGKTTFRPVLCICKENAFLYEIAYK